MKATIENTLVLIPARKGSKGVPGKNSKPFTNGISLTERAIQTALEVLPSKSVVLSTDDETLFSLTEKYGIQLIQRAENLANDTVGMLEVMLDAVEKQNNQPTYLLLLQPTSPFRTSEHLKKAFELFEENDQALVAVNEPAGNPFYTLFEEKEGFISKWSKNNVVRRQDLAPMYDVNGLLYIFEIESLKKQSWVEFDRIRPLVVSKWEAIDIDHQEDWDFAVRLAESK
jgi:CMP-N,N'-diacetyllegionaminic acid synthase